MNLLHIKKKTKEHNVIIIHDTISGIKSLKSSKVIPKYLLPDKDEKNCNLNMLFLKNIFL
jgi:hypothetical protein